MMRIFVLLLLVAGCTQPTATPEAGLEPPGPYDVPPIWQVGDAWTIETGSGSSKRVVTAMSTTDYTIDTTDASTAFFHAREEISNLGSQRRSDLAGSQGTDRVKYFQWPLVDGAMWLTPWDGLQVHITATEQADHFLFEARDGDTVHARYTYDPGLEWFGRMEFYENGTRVFGFETTARESGYSGEVVRARVEEVHTGSLSGPVADSRSVPDPPEADDLYLTVTASCPQGAYAFALGPVEDVQAVAGPQWQGYASNGACPVEDRFEGVIAEAPFAADWVRQTALPPGASVTYTLLARTFETFSVAPV